MARRRRPESLQRDALLVPVELLEPGMAWDRRTWLEARGVLTWRDQRAVTDAARASHGLPDNKPDPFDFFRELLAGEHPRPKTSRIRKDRR